MSTLEGTTHLTSALADLRRKRDEIDAAITAMEAVLETVYGVREQTVARFSPLAAAVIDRPRPRRRSTGTRAERVRGVFEEHPDRVWNAEELAVAVGETPDDATIKAIHAITSRLYNSDMIEKVSRGEYRLIPADHPLRTGAEQALTDASAPAATGAEEGEESDQDSSWKNGGTANGAAPPDGRDDRAPEHAPHGHSGDRRAAIDGGTVLHRVTPSVQS